MMERVSTDATLAAIDGALQDFETSGDAMRWTPVPGRVICDGGQPLMPGPPEPATSPRSVPQLAGIGGRAGLPIVGAVFQDRMNAVAQALSAGLPSGMRFEWGPVDAPIISTEEIRAIGERALAGFRESFNAFARTYGPVMQAYFKVISDMAHTVHRIYYPRQHRRCSRCNPRGHCEPLDGAYKPGPKAARMRHQKHNRRRRS
jgi:hypothetical protein